MKLNPVRLLYKEWKDEVSEDAEARSFWDEFFFIFDIRRRRIASFEYHVKQLNNKDGFIDLFWPSTLIVAPGKKYILATCPYQKNISPILKKAKHIMFTTVQTIKKNYF